MVDEKKIPEPTVYVYAFRYPMKKAIKSGSVAYGPRNEKRPIPGIVFDASNRFFTVSDDLVKRNGWTDMEGNKLQSAKELHEKLVVIRPELGHEFWLFKAPGFTLDEDKAKLTDHVVKQEKKRQVETISDVENHTVKA